MVVSFPKFSLVLGPRHPPIRFVPEALFWSFKMSGCESDHFHLVGVEVRKKSLCAYVSIICPHGMLRDKLPFTHQTRFEWGGALQLKLDLYHLTCAFLYHTQLDTHAPARTPLNESSVCRLGSYEHNKQKKRTSMPWMWFETAIPATKQFQTHTLERTPPGSVSHQFLDFTERKSLHIVAKQADSL
jgi:hypothetical protein